MLLLKLLFYLFTLLHHIASIKLIKLCSCRSNWYDKSFNPYFRQGNNVKN